MPSPLEIVKGAVAEHNPVRIFAMFSGGNDSICSTHLSMGIAEEVLHINTGIGIKKTREHVRTVCAQYGWPLREEYPPQMTYRQLVLKYGFPGPGMHYLSYRILKERAIRKVIRESKTKRSDKVMLITGVRSSESARRMGYVEPVRMIGSQIWVAPIWEWSKRDCNEYRAANNLPESEVASLLHMSGECLCGSFAKPDELKEIAYWFPQDAEEIYTLQREAKEAGVHCIWGTRPKKQRSEELPFMPLCAGCEGRP